MVWWWFWANMAGQRNKNAFKFLLILLILSQKHILGVKKVVWDGLDVVWRWFVVFWGVSTDPIKIFLVFVFLFCFFLQNSKFALPGVMIACDCASRKR